MVRSVLVVQHQDDCPPALVGDWLVEAGCALDVRRPYAGDELPADLSGHDALMVLGGSMGAHDDADHPWLTPTKALVRNAVATSTPTLGHLPGPPARRPLHSAGPPSATRGGNSSACWPWAGPTPPTTTR